MIVEDTSLDESKLEVDVSKVDAVVSVDVKEYEDVDPKESVESEFDKDSSEELVVDSED